MELYSEQIIDLYKHPLNKRIMENADISHSGANSVCGDYIRVYVKLNSKKKVAKASFEGDGCSISVAAASLFTEKIKNKSLNEILKMDTKYILKLLGVTLGPARIKCAVLCLETLQKGITSQKKRSSG